MFLKERSLVSAKVMHPQPLTLFSSLRLSRVTKTLEKPKAWPLWWRHWKKNSTRSKLKIIGKAMLVYYNKSIQCDRFRYSVIAYGGLPPFDSPRAIVYNNQIFSNSSQTKYYFDHIRTGNSNDSDTFDAISVARELIFRPGASKSFILLPCTRCNASNMKVCWEFVLNLSFNLNRFHSTV